MDLMANMMTDASMVFVDVYVVGEAESTKLFHSQE